MEHTITSEPEARPAPAAQLSFGRHLVIGLASALVSPFTGLAWPLALLVGMVIGRDRVEREDGRRITPGSTVIRLLAVTGGVLGMMVLGAVIGGLIAFTIVALAAGSERLAARASSTDRTIARLLLIVVTSAGWLILVNVIGLRFMISVGS
jgi:hypothetical protein